MAYIACMRILENTYEIDLGSLRKTIYGSDWAEQDIINKPCLSQHDVQKA